VHATSPRRFGLSSSCSAGTHSARQLLAEDERLAGGEAKVRRRSAGLSGMVGTMLAVGANALMAASKAVEVRGGKECHFQHTKTHVCVRARLWN